MSTVLGIAFVDVKWLAVVRLAVVALVLLMCPTSDGGCSVCAVAFVSGRLLAFRLFPAVILDSLCAAAMGLGPVERDTERTEINTGERSCPEQ